MHKLLKTITLVGLLIFTASTARAELITMQQSYYDRYSAGIGPSSYLFDLSEYAGYNISSGSFTATFEDDMEGDEFTFNTGTPAYKGSSTQLYHQTGIYNDAPYTTIKYERFRMNMYERTDTTTFAGETAQVTSLAGTKQASSTTQTSTTPRIERSMGLTSLDKTETPSPFTTVEYYTHDTTFTTVSEVTNDNTGEFSAVFSLDSFALAFMETNSIFFFSVMGLEGDFLLSSAKLEFDASLPSATPIPGAVWLLGSGLIGLVGLRRKYSDA
ncbi:VPLPA-CTERM sorting domain-containing protein [Pseudodesulfovibrio sp. zrk46]|uniref:VPLPA-CTERM sorting domain-containing protein n=1 Tax=Pseudodesulfovibrio sp. zrk46 TaxID=2725288 RepID=UPI001449A09B|nr:VPLPA-CTERM sorting domain-containing protein [Pseudodesulfovibrio sp. zrk46]QJB56652.1 hypothetical protein HFN16_09655 [Pseudodesulfovibrio sp. zrk46]